MTMADTIQPRKGFDWSLVAWGKPNSRPRELCSYCHAKIDDDDVPLMLWKPDGSMAQFCERCIERWWA